MIWKLNIIQVTFLCKRLQTFLFHPLFYRFKFKKFFLCERFYIILSCGLNRVQSILFMYLFRLHNGESGGEILYFGTDAKKNEVSRKMKQLC